MLSVSSDRPRVGAECSFHFDGKPPRQMMSTHGATADSPEPPLFHSVARVRRVSNREFFRAAPLSRVEQID
jgi:hypothetical protein